MKQSGNCILSGFRCPFFASGAHPGFTGLSGTITWSYCHFHEDYIRRLKSCELAGDRVKQKDAFINKAADKEKVR